MTRDEAITAFNEHTNIHHRGDTERWIKRFEALGMLKLDEPKNAGQKFADIAYELFGASGYIKLWEAFEAAKIRVVSK